MSVYYADESVTLHHGDALGVLGSLPEQSVDCCVTSPPYFGLRDYGVAGQLGLEASPAEYVENLRVLFAEVRRVLAVDGTLWLNLGDSYSGGNRGVYDPAGHLSDGVPLARPINPAPAKNLLGMPWRVALALQDDGWILRNAVVWNKPNAMPESVTDRLSCRYETVFLFSRSPRYWFDLDPIREPIVSSPEALSWARDSKEADVPGQSMRQHRASRSGRTWDERKAAGEPMRYGLSSQADLGTGGFRGHARGSNPGDVWSINTQPFTAAHFAVMPVTLAERCIQAGCKPGGTVLDPFSGSGTTGLAAARRGQRYVGIDLNRDYLDLSLRTRLAQSQLIDGAAL